MAQHSPFNELNMWYLLDRSEYKEVKQCTNNNKIIF